MSDAAPNYVAVWEGDEGNAVSIANFRTDKARIVVNGPNAAAYGVQLYSGGNVVGNLYANIDGESGTTGYTTAAPGGQATEVYVGVGNTLRVFSGDGFYGNATFVIQELGTASSAAAGVTG